MSHDLDNNPPLLEALAFALFISMLHLVIHLPLFRTIGVQAEKVTYVLGTVAIHLLGES